MADELRTRTSPPDAAEAAVEPHVGTAELERRQPTRFEPPADDPAAARAQIERTRLRMSETIDEIEDALSRKKERLQDRLDVLAPVRERPLLAAGLVLGAGVALGLLTGGEREGRRRHDGDPQADSRYWAARAELWEHRARRLLDIARDQQRSLERERGDHARVQRLRAGMRERVQRARRRGERAGAATGSFLEHLRDVLANTVGGYARELRHAIRR